MDGGGDRDWGDGGGWMGVDGGGYGNLGYGDMEVHGDMEIWDMGIWNICSKYDGIWGFEIWGSGIYSPIFS